MTSVGRKISTHGKLILYVATNLLELAAAITGFRALKGLADVAVPGVIRPVSRRRWELRPSENILEDLVERIDATWRREVRGHGERR